jgi:hypothetical protein
LFGAVGNVLGDGMAGASGLSCCFLLTEMVCLVHGFAVYYEDGDGYTAMGGERVCECCGQELPRPASLFDGLGLSPMQRRIAELVLRAGEYGISGARLFDALYADDPDGGPLTGLASLRVQVRNVNRKLAAVGKEVRAPRGGRAYGGEGCYVLRAVAGGYEGWREMWSRPFAYPERL